MVRSSIVRSPLTFEYQDSYHLFVKSNKRFLRVFVTKSHLTLWIPSFSARRVWKMKENVLKIRQRISSGKMARSIMNDVKKVVTVFDWRCIRRRDGENPRHWGPLKRTYVLKYSLRPHWKEQFRSTFEKELDQGVKYYTKKSKGVYKHADEAVELATRLVCIWVFDKFATKELF